MAQYPVNVEYRSRNQTRDPPDRQLADLYGGLLAEEARHHGVYMTLARALADPEVVRTRFAELALVESEILRAEAPFPRLHT